MESEPLVFVPPSPHSIPYSRLWELLSGVVETEPQGIVALKTGFGGTLIMDMLVGEQLPGIC